MPLFNGNREFERLVADAAGHSDDCDCNGCYELGRGAWAPGGFMNPLPSTEQQDSSR